MKVNIANPEFHELAEYNRMIKELREAYPGISMSVIRSGDNYAANRTLLRMDDVQIPIAEAVTIYPHTPNPAVGQVKADILALAQCMTQIGMHIEFVDHKAEPKESLTITKTKLSSCVSIKQLVSILEDANHEKLPEVLAFIEMKRTSGGRPSKKSVVDLVFAGVKPTEAKQPLRTGMAWASVKSSWKERFSTSKFAKSYKSLDEFCTFATDLEVSQ